LSYDKVEGIKMQAEKFLLIGNDKKMQACRNRLAERGFAAVCCEKEMIKEKIFAFPNIILPLPTLANGVISGTGLSVEEFAELAGNDRRIFYGNLSFNPFGEQGKSYYNESFLVKNSRLTAQGALRIILENIDRDLYSIKAAVLGYGRCGRAICKALQANGANVISVSRSAYSNAVAENEKLNTMSFKEFFKDIQNFDVIVNTVPYNIIEKTTAERLTSKNLYIEIASKPYGFNINETDKYNFRYILAESLPGRFSPASAGENIADTVIEIIKEGKNE
jgi:dipicolinate synthase subunit A